MKNIDIMVDRFLAWQLPKSVCSDLCVTDSNYPHPRSGTSLLTATEARAMLEHVLKGEDETKAPPHELMERFTWEHPDTNKFERASRELQAWLRSAPKTSSPTEPGT